METDESDETLIQQFCRDHNELAFRTLLHRYHVRIESLVCSILGSTRPSDLQDVVQEVFLRVYRGLPTFRHEARFSTWLYRIAHNQAINHKLRSPRRTKQAPREMLEAIFSDYSDPTAAIQQQQLREQLDLALERLPADYQTAVRLHYWQQLPISSIAEMMVIPENTVKSYLHRARKLLVYQLKHQRDSL